MREVRCALEAVISRTHDVKSFRFTKPDDFDFVVGQFVWVMFDEADPRNKNLNKILSLSCCPDKDYLEVTKKISKSDFSKALLKLRHGDEVLIKGAAGRCTVDILGPDVCFLSGGIGITPVYPMLEYVTQKGLEHELTLIYANWTEQDIVFKEEINRLQDRNPRIQVYHVLAETDHEDEHRLKGMIDQRVMEQCVPDIDQKEFFIFGPPAMVASMKSLCESLGVASDRIMTESFTGY
jgi:ferredoxin-NADP reductase